MRVVGLVHTDRLVEQSHFHARVWLLHSQSVTPHITFLLLFEAGFHLETGELVEQCSLVGAGLAQVHDALLAKVGAAFDAECLCAGIEVVVEHVVVAAQDEVDAGFVGHEFAVVFVAHVAQRYDVVLLGVCSLLVDEPFGTVQLRLVLHQPRVHTHGFNPVTLDQP